MITVDRNTRLANYIEHAAHHLPSQGPIRVFVHHNTLHAFEELPFEKAVVQGYHLLGGEPYLSESTYRLEWQRGRIRQADLEAALLNDLGDEADRLVAMFGTRYSLRLAMLRFPMQIVPERELQWLLAESSSLRKFQSNVDPATAAAFLTESRRWLIRAAQFLNDALPSGEHRISSSTDQLLQLGITHREVRSVAKLNSEQFEAFTLRILWSICKQGVATVHRHRRTQPPISIRHRDQLISATGIDTDGLVHQVLIPFIAAFVDQGFADWTLPNRDEGLLRSFLELYSLGSTIVPDWLRSLPKYLKNVRLRSESSEEIAFEIIANELDRLKVPESEREKYIEQTLLALPGWFGMVHQLESNAPWTPRPARAGSLVELTAVRLLLDRIACEYVVATSLSQSEMFDATAAAPFVKGRLASDDCDGTAYNIFQLAQARLWLPQQLLGLSTFQWHELVTEVQAFSGLERRRVFHAAYERSYRMQALDAIAAHVSQKDLAATGGAPNQDAFYVVTCIDEREESFRRHLEETAPECRTFAAAGFFAVVMYYRGAAEAHYRPLCPINVVPQHYVVEEPVFSAYEVNEKRTRRRKMFGRVSHKVHTGSRTAVGGALTGLLGSLATFPLVARVLAPRTTSRLREAFRSWVKPPGTDLHLERLGTRPGTTYEGLGYSKDEMARIVVRLLQDIGLIRDFAPIVLLLGHGSSSLNNPHESAYNCGACSGGRGGPNARAFAAMANDPHVRNWVRELGIDIPDSVRFIGGYHNTCNDSVDYFDLDELPRTHHALFRTMEEKVDAARCRNAHERCRRFESASCHLSPPTALQHVEERSEDLSQARPEYNHATNAMCIVGRRELTRGLFLDRRAFLASYDPTTDSEDGRILERILQAAIPVCGGISLEYYFSTVDPEIYGCGSKLPHNITSLLGVMTGAASDLRPGLSAQMVEIHEPMRILFVVECVPATMARIIAENPIIQQLVVGRWVQLALIDNENQRLWTYDDGVFRIFTPESSALPTVASSRDWYSGIRDHLPFAQIVGGNADG